MAHDRAMAEAQRELAGMRGEVTPYGPISIEAGPSCR
jgi:hypothetical protein